MQHSVLPISRIGSRVGKRMKSGFHRAPGRFWHALTDPAEALRGTSMRRRATLLSALLAVGLGIGVCASVAWLHAHEGMVGAEATLAVLMGNITLAGAYLLSRTSHFRLAAGIAVGAALLGSWFGVVADFDAGRVGALIACTLTGILLCSIFFSVRMTLLVGALNVGAAAAATSVHSSLTAHSDLSILASTGALTAVVLAVGLLMRQQLRDVDRYLRTIEASKERYLLAARGANDGLWDWSPAEGTAYFSPRWAAMIGLPEEPIVGHISTWFDRVHPDDVGGLRDALDAHLDGDTNHFECTHRVVAEDGRVRWLLARGLVVHDDVGEPVRMAGSMTDITRQKVVERQLLHEAMHDALTSLPNRTLFRERLEQTVGRSKTEPDFFFSILYVDLDRFKIVNDSLGHKVGDLLLVDVARRLQSCVRPVDTVARLGGDEFCVLLNGLQTPRAAEVIAERIQQALAEPCEIHGNELVISASIGIAHSESGYDSGDDVIRDADNAMFDAKQSGKARHEVFDPSKGDASRDRLRLESELRRAVSENQLRLQYQPLVRLADGDIVGFEALVRWDHPTLGVVPPMDFIPMAEETGLIKPMGWWILEEACRQARAWQDSLELPRPPQMNVNVSGCQFREADFCDRVLRVLDSTGMEPRKLRLEITETVAMESTITFQEVLAGLRAAGIQVCIDDFGTGYSSLSYLHEFEVDSLKIDKGFVGRIADTVDRPAIVKTIVDLSRSLGLGATAEGVESQKQVDVLKRLGCEIAQGFFFAPPLDPADAEALLREKRRW